MHKVLLLPNISGAPTLVGVYKDYKKEQEFHITKPLSDGLVPLFMEFEKKNIYFDSLYFVRGPGSFMALKLVYLFAKTLHFAKGIKLYATDAFHFNAYSPIKAYGKYYFIWHKDCKNLENKPLEYLSDGSAIALEFFEQTPEILPFYLPEILDISIFGEDLKPLYLLPPI